MYMYVQVCVLFVYIHTCIYVHVYASICDRICQNPTFNKFSITSIHVYMDTILLLTTLVTALQSAVAHCWYQLL